MNTTNDDPQGRPERDVSQPCRVQLSRARGWRMPPNTVKVDRSTRWGNPYPVTTTRENAIAAFANWLDVSLPGQEVKEAARRELRGKNLACWCKLGEPCHADVLLEMANGLVCEEAS